VASFFESIGKIIIRFNKPKMLSHAALSFENAKTIGIIYKRDNLLVETTIDKLFEILGKKQKTVFSIEYIPSDNDTEYKLKEKNHYSLRKEDINIFQLPKKTIRESFCNINFDILINLCPDNHEFIHNTILLCLSKLYIGLSTNRTDIYDIIIDSGESKDFKSLVNYIFESLEKIIKH